MRRALLLLSLVLSVAVSPIGGLAHAYQHHTTGKSDPSHSKHESSAPCGLCTVFVALEHAASGPHALPVTVGTATPPSTERASGIVARHFLHFNQRAPPAVL